jgi:hypothetical protein
MGCQMLHVLLWKRLEMQMLAICHNAMLWQMLCKHTNEGLYKEPFRDSSSS